MEHEGISCRPRQTGVTGKWVAARADRDPHYAHAVHKVARGQRVSATEAWELLRGLAPVPCHAPLVRLGSRFDGGYLVPLEFRGITTALAAGNETNKEFEDDLAQGVGLQVYMCDRSSSEGAFTTPWDREQQSLRKCWLGDDPSPDFLSINEWIRETAPSDDFLLKMDIEGYEYSNLLSIADEWLARIRILVVEFHFLHLMARPEFFFLAFQPVIDRLLKRFDVVHLHPNNYQSSAKLGESFVVPRVVEATFMRKDGSSACRAAPRAPVILPHPVDASNAPSQRPNFLGPPFLRYADRLRSTEEQKSVQRRWEKWAQSKMDIGG